MLHTADLVVSVADLGGSLGPGWRTPSFSHLVLIDNRHTFKEVSRHHYRPI